MMRHNQRGSALLIAMIIISIMTLLGFIVLDAVVGDLEMVTASRQKEMALYVAEGGIAWAVDQIGLAYANETAFGDLTLSSLSLSDVATQSDPGCPNTECSVLLNPSGWRRLTSTAAMPYSSGEFFVYIRDDDDGDDNSDVDVNGTVWLRAIGRSGKNSGASRVLEVAIQIGR